MIKHLSRISLPSFTGKFLSKYKDRQTRGSEISNSSFPAHSKANKGEKKDKKKKEKKKKEAAEFVCIQPLSFTLFLSY